MSELADYRYRGARALVLLHDRYLREFLTVWRQARAAEVSLPVTEDPAYESLHTLLYHVFGCAYSYMTWICEKLELPDPGLPRPPGPDEIEARADAFLDELLAGWRRPLRDLPFEAFEGKTYASRWGDEYSVDAMLEHAVMHPIRHSFQLRELIAAGAGR